jgi:RHS repeat-associated protein
MEGGRAGRLRLTAFDGANTVQRFQYDANGNRTRATFGANTYVNTINATGNRLASTTGPAPAKQNSYDATGNLVSDGTIQYKYGSDGRLSGVVRGGVTTGYRYNGLGQRVAKTSSAGVAVHYVYDELGRLLGEYDAAGKAIQETVYLGDMPVAVLKSGMTSAGTKDLATPGIYYVYSDHLSAPRVLTRASDNKIVWRWDDADPFGLDQPDQNPARLGLFIYSLRFPGQVFDSETHNHYNYFRDYDPQTGRYVQSDPIGLDGGINTYGYVKANPTNLVDPLGLADINLFKSSQPRLFNSANNWNPPNVFSVAGHGSFYNMSDADDNILYAHHMAKMIRSHPNFHGQRVVLGSCNTARNAPGKNAPTFAQRLANYLGVPVTSSTNLTYPPRGDLDRIPENGEGGVWTTVYPQANYKGLRF